MKWKCDVVRVKLERETSFYWFRIYLKNGGRTVRRFWSKEEFIQEG